MDEQTKRTLIKRIGEVPADIRELILSDTLTEDITAVAKENELNEVLSDKIQAEVRLVLLGITDLDHFSENIQAEVGIDSKQTADIVIAVDKQVFSLVRDSLNMVHGYIEPEVEITGREVELAEPQPSQTPVANVPIASPKSGSAGDNTAIPQKDLIAGSILGNNRKPGSVSDPYRESIDEE